MRGRGFVKTVLFLALVSTLCGAQKKPDVVLDDLENPFPISLPPRTIISLAPNITEILFSLGLGDKIAGITRFCDYPAETSKKEKIGGMVDPLLEKIQALHPDLVIAFRGNPLRVVARLKELHLPVFVLQEGTRVKDVFRTIEKIGLVTGRAAEAEGLAASLASIMDRTREALRNTVTTPRVFLSLHGSGLWSCGRESFLSDLLEKAGAANIAGGISRNWLLMGRELFIQKDPEVIVILAKSQADFVKGREWFRNEPGFKNVTAVRSGRIYHLDENAASRFGPRLLETLDRLARLLHPEAY